MPFVEVNIAEGRTREQKDKMAKAITEAVVRELGAPPESVRVLIREFRRDDYTIAGVPMSQRG